MTNGTGSVGADDSWNLTFTDGQTATSSNGSATVSLTNYYDFDAFAATNTLDASNAGQGIWYHNYGSSDTVTGSAFDDIFYNYGTTGGNLYDGGLGNDYIEGGRGSDTIYGGDGDDEVVGDNGSSTTGTADYIDLGAGNDTVYASGGADTILGGTGDDLIYAHADGDTIILEDNFGNDTIYGGENVSTGTDSDTLDMSAVTTDLTVDLTGVEAGTITDGTSTATFTEIENVVLGAGADTIILADGSGVDVVEGFEAPTPNGDGTFTGIDTLDVTGLTDAGGNPVNVADVTVTDTIGDGTGDAILTFPNGESITLVGVLSSQVDSAAELEAIGIPPVGPVDGTAGSDTMGVGFVDAQGDTIDGADGVDDTIYGYAGSDTINAGAGNNTVYGGADEDTILVTDGFGNDTVVGGEGGVDNDTIDLSALTSGVNVSTSGNESGTITDGTDTITFSQTEELILTDQIDTVDAIGDLGGVNIDAGAGDDTLINIRGTSSVSGGDGNDTIIGKGNDTPGSVSTIFGGAGDDTIDGLDQSDIIYGGAGNDTLEAGEENNAGDDDTIFGGTGDDIITSVELSNTSNDLLYGGTGNDTITVSGGDANLLSGGDGQDTLQSGAGSDTLDGGADEDTIIVTNTFGNDTIIGGETVTTGTDFDTLDLSAVTTDLTVDLTGVEAGTITDGTSTATFTEIENVVLGAGADTIILADGSGVDVVEGFEAPTPNGDGTFTGTDTLDVTGLTDGTDPVDVNDVTISDDGSGNAVLSFPNGESITLIGISPTDADNPFYLNAIGIPLSDGTVSGTSGNDVIDVNYTGDPDGDLVDAGDAILAGDTGDDDLIEAGAGNDSITAGAGNDEVYGGTGQDTVDGGIGDDTLYGGDGRDEFILSDGIDTIDGGGAPGFDFNDIDELNHAGVTEGVTYTWTGLEEGIATWGTNTTTFTEIEAITVYDPTFSTAGTDDIYDATLSGDGITLIDYLGGADTVYGSDFTDDINIYGGGLTRADDVELYGGLGDDYVYVEFGSGTLYGGDGDDRISISGPDGNATLYGGSGNDTVYGDDGSQTVYGGIGDDFIRTFEDADVIVIEDNFGNDIIQAGETVSTGLDHDVLDGSGLTQNVTVTATANEAGTITNGTDTSTFTGVEEINTGSGNDTIDLGADTSGMTVSSGAGNDTITGGQGDDVMSGGDDRDTFVVEDAFGTDTIIGGQNGDNYDIIDLTGLTNPVSIAFTAPGAGTITDLVTGDVITFSEIEEILATDQDDIVDHTNNDNYTYIQTLGGNDSVVGSTGNDVLDDQAGVPDGAGNDTFYGGAGDDTIWAGNDNDTIFGGVGSDSLNGQAGDDTITFADGDVADGGAGDDRFVLEDLGETGNGTITIIGGNGGETTDPDGAGPLTGGDTLQLGSLADLSTLVQNSDGINVDGNETFSGSVTLDDGTILNFSEIENIICFTPGTRIATPQGLVNVEDLEIGDMVVTRDHGLQPIRWIEGRTVPAVDRFAPVRIGKNVLAGQERDLIVSPQHRVLFQGYRAELLFGESEVLVSAKHLVDGLDVTQNDAPAVTYVHMLFDQHEIIYAEGAATESFHPGDIGFSAVADEAREELFAIFPELRVDPRAYGSTARRCLKKHEAKLIRT